ncbi:MAG: hypothetical protein IPP55_17510 [Anaerolineales bacterium]|nr:hypothetical protein [Anaerolineales bacterium]
MPHQTASSGGDVRTGDDSPLSSFHTLALDTPDSAPLSPPSGFSIRYLSDFLYAACTNSVWSSCLCLGHHTGSAIAADGT